uniref:hypothetical protein n=1 Tax=Salmonella sp. s51228 TaxID=3159652 RepID=UPI00397EBF77
FCFCVCCMKCHSIRQKHLNANKTPISLRSKTQAENPENDFIMHKYEEPVEFTKPYTPTDIRFEMYSPTFTQDTLSKHSAKNSSSPSVSIKEGGAVMFHGKSHDSQSGSLYGINNKDMYPQSNGHLNNGEFRI